MIKSLFLSLLLFGCNPAFAVIIVQSSGSTPAIDSTLLLTDEYFGATDTTPAVDETTSSITTVDDSMIVVMLTIANEDAAVFGNTTVSGGGLTWSNVIDQGDDYLATYYITTEIWAAQVTTGASITLDIDASMASGSSFGANMQYSIWSVENADTVSALASGVPAVTGSYSLTLSSAPASTSLVMAARGITAEVGTATTATEGTGWTELFDLPDTGSIITSFQGMERGGSTSDQVTWDVISSHATVTMNSTVAAEITQ